MRKLGIGPCSDINLRARPRRKLFVSGNKIGVQMSLEYVPDFKILLAGRLQIDVYVALWIKHRSLALGSNHVRSMRQTGEVELFKIHRRLRTGFGSRRFDTSIQKYRSRPSSGIQKFLHGVQRIMKKIS